LPPIVDDGAPASSAMRALPSSDPKDTVRIRTFAARGRRPPPVGLPCAYRANSRAGFDASPSNS
jgi:hypothetical protein